MLEVSRRFGHAACFCVFFVTLRPDIQNNRMEQENHISIGLRQAVEAISSQLRRELPGLRGYSASALKNMRKFYENWSMLDPDSSVATDE